MDFRKKPELKTNNLFKDDSRLLFYFINYQLFYFISHFPFARYKVSEYSYEILGKWIVHAKFIDIKLVFWIVSTVYMITIQNVILYFNTILIQKN